MKSNIKTLLVCLSIPVVLAGCASGTCLRYETSYPLVCDARMNCRQKSVMNCVRWVADPKKVPFTPVAVPDGYPPNTIFPGAGLKDCNITQDVADTCKRFSLSLVRRVSDHYFSNKEDNIDFVNAQHKDIMRGGSRRILFTFDGRRFDSMSGALLPASSEFRPFQGQTDRGIGINSSPRDVVTKYGKPDYETDKHSRHYSFVMQYDRGISFTFLNINNKPVLQWISVFPRKIAE